MNNPFLKRLMKDKSEDILHSSPYARAQSGSAFGATSTQSFNARMAIERNRSNVRSYGDSRIVGEARSGAPRAKTFDAGTSNSKPAAVPPIRKNPGISR